MNLSEIYKTALEKWKHMLQPIGATNPEDSNKVSFANTQGGKSDDAKEAEKDPAMNGGQP